MSFHYGLVQKFTCFCELLADFCHGSILLVQELATLHNFLQSIPTKICHLGTFCQVIGSIKDIPAHKENLRYDLELLSYLNCNTVKGLKHLKFAVLWVVRFMLC